MSVKIVHQYDHARIVEALIPEGLSDMRPVLLLDMSVIILLVRA